MLAPGGLYLFPEPWNMIFAVEEPIVWITVLIFLLQQARVGWRMRRRFRGDE
jgi:hypothetical protein